MPVELHCHSIFSDGELEPTDLVRRAQALGLTTLALTDHDTVDGLYPLEQAALGTRIRVVTGVELSCTHEGKEVHLLGYFFDPDDTELRLLLQSLQQERRERIALILAKLKSLGLFLSYSEVLEQSRGGTIGRPHVAKALVAKGFVADLEGAFRMYLGDRAPAYVGRSLLSLTEAIGVLHRAGGCAVLAHPGTLMDWALVERIVKLPIDGLEVWHPSHGKAARKRAKKLGGRYQKVLSGGSDFHRPSGIHDLGSSREVTEKVVERLRLAASGAEAISFG